MRQRYNFYSSYPHKFSADPISGIIEAFAREKAELRKKGQLIDDFDLLIGMTAQVYGYTLVTENVKHLSRISNIEIENWISR